MRPRTGLSLLLAGLIVLACGWYFGPASQSAERDDFAAGRLLFPDLAPKLRNAARVEILHQGKTLAIAKKGSEWGLADRGNYPVQPTKLHALFAGLTELRLDEKRTADPAQFARLGVEDAGDAKSGSDLVRVLDGSGKPIVQLLVGHRRTRTQGNLPDTVYVRLPGDNQSWLAEGKLEVDADARLWLDRDIMKIAPARIASVAATRGATTLQFARDGDKLVLRAPADHPPLDADKENDVGHALEALTLQDVKPAKDVSGQPEASSVFTTDDGLAVTVSLSHMDKDLWARFDVSGSDKSRAEADRLRTRLGGWAYQIGSWQEKSLAPTLDDLKAPAPKS
jgi:uncharacterized protein DUF4340